MQVLRLLLQAGGSANIRGSLRPVKTPALTYSRDVFGVEVVTVAIVTFEEQPGRGYELLH